MAGNAADADSPWEALRAPTAALVTAAGSRLLERLPARPVFVSRADVVAAIEANDRDVLSVLREPLLALRPGSQWAEDELADGDLPPGEWWVVDPVEGNINHIHGMSEWGVTATLVADGRPVLTAVSVPMTHDVYTAAAGGGALQKGRPMSVSTKTDLDAAIVGTGQASPMEGPDTFDVITASSRAMLGASLVLRVSVPATLQLVHVAAGRTDVFWQYSGVRSGLVSGALLVAEAGGVVTDARGNPWRVGSTSFVATTPALHAQVIDVLTRVGQ